MHTPDHEGLQVRSVPQPDSSGLQHISHHPHYKEGGANGVIPTDTLGGNGAERRVCGLRRRLFITLFILAVVIVAVAVGGGVGGALGAKKSSSSSSTPLTVSTTPLAASSTVSPSSTTTSSTRTTSPSPTSSDMGTYNCPSENGTVYTPSINRDLAFRKLCSADFVGLGINGKSNVKDLSNIVARSIEACIDQCAADRQAGSNCSAVAYGANLTLALGRGGTRGNCYLKDQRSLEVVEDTSGQAEAAYLLST